jgi:hypothetical protein
MEAHDAKGLTVAQIAFIEAIRRDNRGAIPADLRPTLEHPHKADDACVDQDSISEAGSGPRRSAQRPRKRGSRWSCWSRLVAANARGSRWVRN